MASHSLTTRPAWPCTRLCPASRLLPNARPWSSPWQPSDGLKRPARRRDRGAVFSSAASPRDSSRRASAPLYFNHHMFRSLHGEAATEGFKAEQ
jgi:hypothetical protein